MQLGIGRLLTLVILAIRRHLLILAEHVIPGHAHIVEPHEARVVGGITQLGSQITCKHT